MGAMSMATLRAGGGIMAGLVALEAALKPANSADRLSGAEAAPAVSCTRMHALVTCMSSRRVRHGESHIGADAGM